MPCSDGCEQSESSVSANPPPVRYSRSVGVSPNPGGVDEGRGAPRTPGWWRHTTASVDPRRRMPRHSGVAVRICCRGSCCRGAPAAQAQVRGPPGCCRRPGPTPTRPPCRHRHRRCRSQFDRSRRSTRLGHQPAQRTTAPRDPWPTGNPVSTRLPGMRISETGQEVRALVSPGTR